jgi:Gas vesicle synthesis protein GvpL/GvpF
VPAMSPSLRADAPRRRSEASEASSARPAPTDQAPTSWAGAEVTYVYAVLDDAGGADGDEICSRLRGVGGARVKLVHGAGLRAAISVVPEHEFGDEVLKEQLNDLAWLERTAREHEAVVGALLEVGPMVPMRLCTIFVNEARVGGMLNHEAEHLRAALERVRDAEELGVKVLALPEAALPAADDGPKAEATEGAAYLLRQRRRRDTVDDRRADAGRWATEIHEALCDLARDARVNAPTSRELGRYEGDMILNGAYLVSTSAVSEFRARARRLGDDHQRHGLRLELTGPWPPYNFTAETRP